MKLCLTLLASLSILIGAQTPAQTRRALLIGINTYEPAGTKAIHPEGCTYGRCELGHFDNLDGSVNDAQSMSDVLTSPKFGFPASNVVLLANPAPAHPRPGAVVLPPDQTTRDGILAAMQKYLVDTPKRGDTVVFYDASHGSLRVNSKGTKLTVLVGDQLVHADSTLVPSDAYKGGFDVRDREMTHIFNAALDKGIHLTVILDTCHSGGVSRGVGPKYRQRSLPFDPRDIAEAPDLLPNGQPRPAPTERADNPALVFSAAQQDQSSNEMPAVTANSESHGAFTAALVEALQAMPANTPALALFQRVRAVMGAEDVADQDPELDANPVRRQQPLFGGNAADAGKVLTAALQTVDGNVWLDIGRVSGIGVGSEFTATPASGTGQKIQLRVGDLEGIARSSAQVVSPAGASVPPGTILELTKWVPAQLAPLLVWHWPANLSQTQVLAATAQVKAAGAVTVTDPAAEPWTHLLSWDGTQWSLEQAGVPSAISLGAPLTADVLKQHLPASAKLWVNFPPPSELGAKLPAPDPTSAVQPTSAMVTAHYLLMGTLTAAGPAYAWYHTSELAAGPPTAAASSKQSPGCSATSSYPVRTDWVPMTGDAATELTGLASRLAKVHGWLQLADSPAGASTSTYYSLVLVQDGSTTPVSADQPAHNGDTLKMALQSSSPVTQPRWVYVLDISCQGKGQVIYPYDEGENRFPNDADNGDLFLLPGGPILNISEPFGVDTLVMLTTEQPLNDPSALKFDGVVSRGGPGASSPLEQLLNRTSAGTRGDPGPLPTNWSIGLLPLRSIP